LSSGSNDLAQHHSTPRSRSVSCLRRWPSLTRTRRAPLTVDSLRTVVFVRGSYFQGG
jgi:hypothetical protein